MDPGGLDLAEQVQDPHARPGRLVGPSAAGQVVGEFRRVQREVPGEVRVLQRGRPPCVPGRPGPVAQGGPALGLQPLQLRLAVERHPLRVGVRGPLPEQGLRPGQRLLAADPVGEPRPAPRLAQGEQGQQPSRAQRPGGALCGLGGPHRLAGPPGVPGQERHVAEGVRLQGGVAGHAGGGEGLGVVGAGVVEAPGVVRQPAHGDREFPGARVQPVRRRLPGRAGVQQRVGGPQRGRRAPVQAVRAVPVVEQPDPADGFLQGARVARPGPARGPPGRHRVVGERQGAQRGGGHRGTAHHECATQHVALLVVVMRVVRVVRVVPVVRVVRVVRVLRVRRVVRLARPPRLTRGARRAVRVRPGRLLVGARPAPPHRRAGREAQVGERAAGEHVQEHPLVRVVGATDLARLDPADVARVAADPLADLARGPAHRRRELGRRALAAQPPEGEVGPRRPVGPGGGHR